MVAGPELQQLPIDRDLAAADPEKAAEVDHRRAWVAAAIDQNINDHADILTGGAQHLLAEDTGRLVGGNRAQALDGGLPHRRLRRRGRSWQRRHRVGVVRCVGMIGRGVVLRRARRRRLLGRRAIRSRRPGRRGRLADRPLFWVLFRVSVERALPGCVVGCVVGRGGRGLRRALAIARRVCGSRAYRHNNARQEENADDEGN